MKISALFLTVIVLLVGCGGKKDYKPDSSLSPQEQDRLMMAVIRYVGRPPENVGPKEKFDTKYDEYYQQLSGRHKLEKYYVDVMGPNIF